MVDDFTDDEIAEFGAVDDDQRKRIERFAAWQAKEKAKADESGSRGRSFPRAGSENSYDPTLSELERLVETPGKRSILQSLLQAAEASGKTLEQAPGKVKKAAQAIGKRLL